MDNLVDILDSFQPGWRKKEYVDNFIATLKDRVIPAYSFMDSKIENGRAVFPKEWDQVVSALKEVHFFELFVPPEYGGQKTSEEDVYFVMELLGYSSPGMGIFLCHMGGLST